MEAGKYKHSQHETPKVTVDIFIMDPDQKGLVLIKRVNDPQGWALPGGFVDIGETTMAAAIREAREETGCRLTRVEQFHTYSDPARDPRGHGITVAYMATTLDVPVAADDAAAWGWFDLIDLHAYKYDFEERHEQIPANAIVFDHIQMIIDLKHFLDTGQRPTRE